MKKQLLILSILTLNLMVAPLFTDATANAAIEIVDVDDKDPVIHFNNRSIHIENGQGEVVNIYDIRGVMVCSYRINSPSQKIELSNLPKGCYLVKVGKTVRKISVK